jgi:hypothetical protein
MNNTPDYYLTHVSACEPELLDIIKVEHEFQIFEGTRPLLTPSGNPFAHQSERFIRTLLTDIQLRQLFVKGGLPYANLFAYKTDILDMGNDPVQTKIIELAAADPFIKLKIAESQSLQTYTPDEPLFNFAFITLSGLVSGINKFVSRLMSEISIEESETHPILGLVSARYQAMDPWKKAVFQLIGALHGSGIILPLGLTSGMITPAEYSKGLLALKNKQPSDYLNVYTQASDACDFLSSLSESPDLEYKLHQLIRDGEGDTSEFKSTLRWDIRAGKTNQAIERACLKTISAFLNSRGGILLIGVRDDGSIEGIETDKFSNEDKFLLHLWTLIRTCLGRDFSPFIRTVLEKLEDKTVCLVLCQPAGRPVFLRQPGFDEEMFIRVGPSSNALDISEALKYIRDHFSGE